MKVINTTLIREKMKARSLTLQEMSNRLGYKDASTFFRFLAGEQRFRADHVPILLETLEMTMDELFVDDEIAKLANDDSEKSHTA